VLFLLEKIEECLTDLVTCQLLCHLRVGCGPIRCSE
jgi:hypothetical protein